MERLGQDIGVYARKTSRLFLKLYHLVLSSGGHTGARIAQNNALPTSVRSLLRLATRPQLTVLAAPQKLPVPIVVGVDDWAWKKGKTYGTLIVDLERRQPIELLSDRSSQSVAEWLLAHPTVQIVSRDRSPLYAEGIRLGAPKAIQVADRFHIVKNLVEALERFFLARRATLKSCAVEASPAQAASEQEQETLRSIPRPKSSYSSKAGEAASLKRHARYVEYYEKIVELRAKNVDVANIARQVGLSRQGVYRYLALNQAPDRATIYRPKPTRLDTYKPYLLRRWNEGCRNAHQMYREIKEQGFSGSVGMVSSFITLLRLDSGVARSFKAVKDAPTLYQASLSQAARPLTAVQASRLLVQVQAKRLDWQVAYLQRLCEADPQIKLVNEQVQTFMQLVRQLQGEQLDCWLEKAKNSGVVELANFAKSLERDYEAVKTGLSQKWSNGQLEAQIHRLKMLKRAMFGQAGFKLLRQRILYRPLPLKVKPKKRGSQVKLVA